ADWMAWLVIRWIPYLLLGWHVCVAVQMSLVLASALMVAVPLPQQLCMPQWLSLLAQQRRLLFIGRSMNVPEIVLVVRWMLRVGESTHEQPTTPGIYRSA